MSTATAFQQQQHLLQISPNLYRQTQNRQVKLANVVRNHPPLRKIYCKHGTQGVIVSTDTAVLTNS